jgi:hypothetical protein
LQQDLLAFIPLEGSHTGHYLASVVYDTLDEFDIKTKLQCITTDNASNNTTMVRSLSSKLLANDNIHWDYEKNHIPCLAHIINLVVQKFLNTVIKENDDNEYDFDHPDMDIAPDSDSGDFEVKSFKEILATIRRLAISLRSSTAKWEAFVRACKSYDLSPMTIPLDIVVRWNSTYAMLSASVYLQRALRRYVDDTFPIGEKAKYELTDTQWEQAEVLLLFLLPFKRCTDRFESNNTHTEIDYVFFAYDTMYNHIDDIKERLKSGIGIGNLPCSSFMLQALVKMETVLQKYYQKTEVPTVYVDGMILNPRTKLVIFEEETWSDANVDEYKLASRRRFIEQYDQDYVDKSSSSSSEVSRKRGLGSYNNDPEYRDALLNRSLKRRRNDFDRYIEIPNDPEIPSCLGWWRQNHRAFPDLAMMARDILPVPASGCAVERQFSVSGRLAIWQRSRLTAQTISNSMIYKAGLVKTKAPLISKPLESLDADALPIGEKEGSVPEEWMEKWWMGKLNRLPIQNTMVQDMFGRLRDSDDEDDIYGDNCGMV